MQSISCFIAVWVVIFNLAESLWFSSRRLSNGVRDPERLTLVIDHKALDYLKLRRNSKNLPVQFRAKQFRFSKRNILYENPEAWHCITCTDTNPRIKAKPICGRGRPCLLDTKVLTGNVLTSGSEKGFPPKRDKSVTVLGGADVAEDLERKIYNELDFTSLLSNQYFSNSTSDTAAGNDFEIISNKLMNENDDIPESQESDTFIGASPAVVLEQSEEIEDDLDNFEDNDVSFDELESPDELKDTDEFNNTNGLEVSDEVNNVDNLNMNYLGDEGNGVSFEDGAYNTLEGEDDIVEDDDGITVDDDMTNFNISLEISTDNTENKIGLIEGKLDNFVEKPKKSSDLKDDFNGVTFEIFPKTKETENLLTTNVEDNVGLKEENEVLLIASTKTLENNESDENSEAYTSDVLENNDELDIDSTEVKLSKHLFEVESEFKEELDADSVDIKENAVFEAELKEESFKEISNVKIDENMKELNTYDHPESESENSDLTTLITNVKTIKKREFVGIEDDFNGVTLNEYLDTSELPKENVEMLKFEEIKNNEEINDELDESSEVEVNEDFLEVQPEIKKESNQDILEIEEETNNNSESESETSGLTPLPTSVESLVDNKKKKEFVGIEDDFNGVTLNEYLDSSELRNQSFTTESDQNILKLEEITKNEEIDDELETESTEVELEPEVKEEMKEDAPMLETDSLGVEDKIELEDNGAQSLDVEENEVKDPGEEMLDLDTLQLEDDDEYEDIDTYSPVGDDSLDEEVEFEVENNGIEVEHNGVEAKVKSVEAETNCVEDKEVTSGRMKIQKREKCFGLEDDFNGVTFDEFLDPIQVKDRVSSDHLLEEGKNEEFLGFSDQDQMVHDDEESDGLTDYIDELEESENLEVEEDNVVLTLEEEEETDSNDFDPTTADSRNPIPESGDEVEEESLEVEGELQTEFFDQILTSEEEEEEGEDLIESSDLEVANKDLEDVFTNENIIELLKEEKKLEDDLSTDESEEDIYEDDSGDISEDRIEENSGDIIKDVVDEKEEEENDLVLIEEVLTTDAGDFWDKKESEEQEQPIDESDVEVEEENNGVELQGDKDSFFMYDGDLVEDGDDVSSDDDDDFNNLFNGVPEQEESDLESSSGLSDEEGSFDDKDVVNVGFGEFVMGINRDEKELSLNKTNMFCENKCDSVISHYFEDPQKCEQNSENHENSEGFKYTDSQVYLFYSIIAIMVLIGCERSVAFGKKWYSDRFFTYLKELEIKVRYLLQNDENEKAKELIEKNLPRIISKCGETHPHTMVFNHFLARALLGLKSNASEAETLLRVVARGYLPYGEDRHLGLVFEDLGAVLVRLWEEKDNKSEKDSGLGFLEESLQCLQTSLRIFTESAGTELLTKKSISTILSHPSGEPSINIRECPNSVIPKSGITEFPLWDEVGAYLNQTILATSVSISPFVIRSRDDGNVGIPSLREKSDLSEGSLGLSPFFFDSSFNSTISMETPKRLNYVQNQVTRSSKKSKSKKLQEPTTKDIFPSDPSPIAFKNPTETNLFSLHKNPISPKTDSDDDYEKALEDLENFLQQSKREEIEGIRENKVMNEVIPVYCGHSGRDIECPPSSDVARLQWKVAKVILSIESLKPSTSLLLYSLDYLRASQKIQEDLLLKGLDTETKTNLIISEIQSVIREVQDRLAEKLNE